MYRWLLVTLAGVSAGMVSAQRVGAPTDDLTNLSVDDLFRLEVTSVGKKAQELSKAPAAVYVLTADDIRRSGATSIPEALEWVPGLTVLRVGGEMWAISARGSTRLYSDRMLVMIDGRSLYTPLFSGVLWDLLDVPLENIERIEVVRGPGAVMWGLNAVNGVINIITKKAQPGVETSVATGTELRGSVFARWGAAPTEKVSFESWVKLDDRDPASGSGGFYNFFGSAPFQEQAQIDDLNSQSARAGFRLDAQPTAKDQLTMEGDLYKLGRQDHVGYIVLLPDVADYSSAHSGGDGGSLEAKWTRANADGGESTLQFTYSKDALTYPFTNVGMENLTADYQRRLQTSDRNELYWGLGYQQYWDLAQGDKFMTFNPASSVYRDGDVVMRDEFQMVPNRLLVSAGLRVDYNSWSRFEFQPSVRLLYTPNNRQSAWLAFSRAVRVPSRIERDTEADYGTEIVSGLPLHTVFLRSTSLRSEIERSWEAGYRVQSGQKWSMDASVFWSRYDRLIPVTPLPQVQMQIIDGVPNLWVYALPQNAGQGHSYGGEISATWQAASKWRLIPSYSFLRETEQLPPDYMDFLVNSDPRHQGFIRSQYDLSRKLQFDLMARARTKAVPFDIPGVVLLDARIGWRPARGSEISFAVQNLTGRRVLEAYSESPFVSIPLERTFVVRWVQKF